MGGRWPEPATGTDPGEVTDDDRGPPGRHVALRLPRRRPGV